VVHFGSEQVRTTHPRPGERHLLTAPAPSRAICGVLNKFADLPQEAEEEIRDLEQACRRLIVHHRDERNAKPLLITLCIRCHVRLHRSRRLRYWVPEALLRLWRELHPAAPLQLQLPFAVTSCTPTRQLSLREAKEPRI
jgi:hypothetical protein